MILLLIGVIFAALVLYLLWPVFLYYVLRIFLCKLGDIKKSGEWAIVTGSTDGIGKAFAEYLAKQGLNVFLVSRTKSKLEDVAKEIEEKYKVTAKIFVSDFGSEGFKFDELRAEIDKLSTISCLINNVGISYTYPDKFATSTFITPSFIEKMVNVNVTTLAMLTRLTLPKMLNDPLPVPGVKRFVINMSSLSGVYAIPYLGLYGATKAFVAFFTQELAFELKDTCVCAQAFAPSLIATPMTGIKRTSWNVPSSTAYVKSAMSMLGVETVGCGYLAHALSLQFISMLPSCFVLSHLGKRMLRRRHLDKQKSN